MNKSSGFRRKSPWRRNNGRRVGSGTHSLQKFYRLLEDVYGAYHSKSSNGMVQRVCTYVNSPPPRLPVPNGPSKGAQLTITQFARGSDLTLATGSAIVGALIRQSGSSDAYAGFSFCHADMPQSATLGSLFDQYRIDLIQFRLRSRNNAIAVYNTASPNNATCPPLIVIDRDDGAAPTTLSELQQYDNCTQISSQDSIDIVFEPSITPSVFAAGAFSGYAVDDSGKYWIDMANASVPHYGIKVGMPALSATTTSRFDWDVEVWFKVSYRNIR